MLYKLKSTARRALPFGAAAALVLGTFAPVGTVFADALNPLTDRSLTLSSSAPGYVDYDGSGNSTYAPPNSGANGKKTGNTFEFKVSSDSSSRDIRTISFQYCTTSAGDCTSPGNYDAGNADTTSDLDVVTDSPSPVSAGDFSTIVDTSSGAVQQVPLADNSQGNFAVYWNNGGTWEHSAGWAMSTANVENGGSPTGKQNYIILTTEDQAGLTIPANTTVKVVFFGTDTNYITNPGAGEFFVKINTYGQYEGTDPSTTLANLAPQNDDFIIDGGVTVANVMNKSITITTKVLETMQFSVGTVDPNTLDSTDTDAGTPGVQSELATATGGQEEHTPCDPILMGMTPSESHNVLQLGNQAAESSLEVANTYATHSYWRLSSNSSAGASVYYSGVTLSNTVGDQIRPVNGGDGTAAQPTPGGEQFGLAISSGDDSNPGDDVGYAVDYTNNALDASYVNADDNGKTEVHASTLTDTSGNLSWHSPQLFPLVPEADYDGGSGIINGDQANPTDTEFAFDSDSDRIPALLATQSTQVVDCVTAKMRYIANIAATTPAGIYTTSINYIAAPQY